MTGLIGLVWLVGSRFGTGRITVWLEGMGLGLEDKKGWFGMVVIIKVWFG